MSVNLSTRYYEENEVHKNKKLIFHLNSILKQILESGSASFQEIPENHKRYSFYSNKKASTTISAYIDRILKYTHIEESTLIIAIIYLDRICHINQIFLNNYNIHRIFLACVLISIKYNEDDFYSNIYYSKVGGISLKELNILEYECIKLLKYGLFIKSEIFIKYKMLWYAY